MNILIVDDEPDLLESLRRGLRCQRHDTLETTSAISALEILQSSANIDLVITDHLMPDMTGLDLVDWIRKEKGDFPVIIMTAYGDKDLVVQALRSRYCGYIEKPFTLGQLNDEIERTVAHKAECNPTFSDTFCRLAHQINNPLMAIVGSAELSLEEDGINLSPASHERLQNIIAAAEQINTINKKIMGLGRIMVEPPEPIDIGALVRRCVQMSNDLLHLKEIEVHCMDGHHNCIASGSSFALEQVFKNLLLNAIEAMADTSVRRLEISVQRRPATRQVVVDIEDTGIGIPADKRERIFDPYYSSKPKGNGIGLAVVKSILDQFQGAIEVDSTPGMGSRFTVSLPAY